MENNEDFDNETNAPDNVYYTRQAHFIWILDCSESMNQRGKIHALNNVIREVTPKMRASFEENSNVQLLVSAITFSDEARWHIENPIKIKDFKWEDVAVTGKKACFGKAFQLLIQALSTLPKEARWVDPTLVLVSCGRPSDNYEPWLEVLLNTPWGQKARRLSIAIGPEAENGVLHEFMDNDYLKPFQADNANEIVKYLHHGESMAVIGDDHRLNNVSQVSFVLHWNPDNNDSNLSELNELLMTGIFEIAQMSHFISNVDVNHPAAILMILQVTGETKNTKRQKAHIVDWTPGKGRLNASSVPKTLTLDADLKNGWVVSQMCPFNCVVGTVGRSAAILVILEQIVIEEKRIVIDKPALSEIPSPFNEESVW